MRNRNSVKILKGLSDGIRCLKVLSNNLFACGCVDATIKLFEGFSGECIKTLVGHSGWVNYLDVLMQQLLISSSSDQTLRVWNLENEGICIKILHMRHTNGINCIKLISNKELLSGSYDGCLKVWDLKTGLCLRTIQTDTSLWKIEYCSVLI